MLCKMHIFIDWFSALVLVYSFSPEKINFKATCACIRLMVMVCLCTLWNQTGCIYIETYNIMYMKLRRKTKMIIIPNCILCHCNKHWLGKLLQVRYYYYDCCDPPLTPLWSFLHGSKKTLMETLRQLWNIQVQVWNEWAQ